MSELRTFGMPMRKDQTEKPPVNKSPTIPMLLDKIVALENKLDAAQYLLNHIYENTQCIGLDKCHVDGNCIHCLAGQRLP
jgi:hypothetical protein